MKRAAILLIDSLGIGSAEDADKYGDKGSDTLGHIVEECAAGKTDNSGIRKGPLFLPNLARMGLQKAAEESRNAPLAYTPYLST